MNKFTTRLIELLKRSLCNEVVKQINAASLDEPDTRGLISWADGGSDEN